MTVSLAASALAELAAAIKTWGRELGFQQVGIADVDLDEAEARLLDWLAAGFHGAMSYMARHGVKRSRPAELVPGTVRVISARMDYLPPGAADPWSVLNRPDLGYVSRYALGRDYHKVLRQRLQRLAERIVAAIGPFGYRVFADSAPVLEKALAEKAGLGWIGKHSNLLDRRAGSWFFLGEIYVDLPLPVDSPATAHCGRCTACLDICPTRAIVAPYRVDARRCISYHTIELPGPIPLEFRRAIGNRIYGCDDCQLVCPWNRFARPTRGAGFPRPAWPGRAVAGGTVRLGGRGVSAPHRGQRHPPHRPRTLAAQYRRGAGQRAPLAGGHGRLAGPARASVGAGAGARRLGAGGAGYRPSSISPRVRVSSRRSCSRDSVCSPSLTRITRTSGLASFPATSRLIRQGTSASPMP